MLCSRSSLFTVVLFLCAFASLVRAEARAQQVVQRGAFGKPSQVLDETNQWTTPLSLASDRDVEIYIPDVTSPDWLKANYPNFHDRGVYVLSMFTFYKTPVACRTNQIGWGLGDAAHLNACIATGYRVRRAQVDSQQRTVILLQAAMVDQNGQLDSASIQDKGVFRTWDQLDSNTQTALKKANALITEQMGIYDRKVQSSR